MIFRWINLFYYFMLSMLLAGCSSLFPQQVEILQRNKENLKLWDDANTKFIACNRSWQADRRKLSSQFNDIVTSADDPRYFKSLTSKDPISQEFKEALVRFRPQQIACRKALFKDLGDKNIRVKLLYQDSFQAFDAGVVDVLDGRLKTMGEVNRVYIKLVDDANDARMILRGSLQGFLD